MISTLLDILYPNCCIACKTGLSGEKKNDIVCDGCYSSLEMNVPPFCQRCGRHLSEKDASTDTCSQCRTKTLHFDRCWSASIYNEPMKNLLHLFKYAYKTALRKPFGRLMADYMKRFSVPLMQFDYLAAMPLHATRLREREYNQSQLLAEELAKIFPIMLLNNAVVRIRHTKPQSLLGAKQRWDNIRGAFAVKKPGLIRGRSVLVIDDLYTTGATASEIAATFKNAGAARVGIATLAIAQ